MIHDSDTHQSSETATSVPSASAQRVVVLGAGPVGLTAALLLARQGRDVSVLEAQTVMPLSDDNSYPIGVNRRGQEALRQIDPAILDQLHRQGEVVAGFRIRSGRRTLATLPSGTLVATTRARLTRILLDAASREPRIRLVTGQRLCGLDPHSRTLTITTDSDEQATIDASDALVLACDGVWSPARRALTESVDGFDPDVAGWGVRFRVLFSQPGASAPGLDPAWHHIFTSKGIYTATLPGGVWCVAVTAIEGDPAESLLLSGEASDQHVAALRAHLDAHAPLVRPLLTDEDYRAYFSRKPFGGAVVRCPRVSHDEWLVLLGDAAHSVIPPTGEGVNSGLEDARLLADALASGSPTPLADYDRKRMPDLRALGEYATHLKDNISSDDPNHAAGSVLLRILGSAAARLGHRDSQVEARLFGPDAGPNPYREIIGPWIAFRDRWSPAARAVVTGARTTRRLVERLTTRALHHRKDTP